MRPFSVIAVYVVHYGDDYLEYSIRSIYGSVDKILISVGLESWNYAERTSIDPVFLAKIKELPLKYSKIELVYGTWAKDEDQRNDSIPYARDYDYYFLVDTDEIYRQEELANLYSIVEKNPGAGVFRIPFYNFWRGFGYVIQEAVNEPVQRFFKNSARRFYFKRSCTSGYRKKAQFDVSRKDCSCYHFSYARKPDAIEHKFKTWMHADEVRQRWVKKVFAAWEQNKMMTNLFPVAGQEDRWISAQPFDAAKLPSVLLDHPYHGMDVIK